MRFVFILFLISCSSKENIQPNLSIESDDVFFISFSKKSGYGIITDRYSCLGRNELFEVWAFPADGYDFIGWSGSYNSKENPILVKVDSNKNIIAEFSN